MSGPVGRKMHMVGPGDPLVSELERKLGDLVGVLSKFIVEKSYSETTHDGYDKLDFTHAKSMCSSIIDEANILLGPKRTKELNEEFDKFAAKEGPDAMKVYEGLVEEMAELV